MYVNANKHLVPLPLKTLLERKKKWQAERQRRDEEVEELRKSSQQELDNVRAQLRKARTSTDNAASEQVSPMSSVHQRIWMMMWWWYDVIWSVNKRCFMKTLISNDYTGYAYLHLWHVCVAAVSAAGGAGGGVEGEVWADVGLCQRAAQQRAGWTNRAERRSAGQTNPATGKGRQDNTCSYEKTSVWIFETWSHHNY